MEGNHFLGVEGVTKAKNVYFHKKLVFSIFGQKRLFLVKPTYVLLPITKERKRVETNGLFLMKEESLLCLLVVSVFYIVIELTVPWVFGNQSKCCKTLGLLCFSVFSFSYCALHTFWGI